MFTLSRFHATVREPWRTLEKLGGIDHEIHLFPIIFVASGGMRGGRVPTKLGGDLIKKAAERSAAWLFLPLFIFSCN